MTRVQAVRRECPTTREDRILAGKEKPCRSPCGPHAELLPRCSLEGRGCTCSRSPGEQAGHVCHSLRSPATIPSHPRHAKCPTQSARTVALMRGLRFPGQGLTRPPPPCVLTVISSACWHSAAELGAGIASRSTAMATHVTCASAMTVTRRRTPPPGGDRDR